MNRQIEYRFIKATGEVAYCTLEQILRHSQEVPTWVYEYPECHRDMWTGFMDVNGKKIFEADILEAIGEHEEMCSCDHCFNVRKGDKVVVVWLDGGFRLYPADEYKEFDKREEQMAGTCNWCVLVSENLMSPNHEVDVSCYFEVIGDKFTAPELLNNI